jgi:RNase adapter protein RapZ
MTEPTRPYVVVVTGVSGAGKSTVLHGLEDLGFFCIDNLPTVMAPQAVELCLAGGIKRIALGIDVRVRAFLGNVGPVLEALSLGDARNVEVVFCDASDEAILRRFSETRRPHALASDPNQTGAVAVLDGLRIEREHLAPLRARATRVVDTTALSVHDLRRIVFTHFSVEAGAARAMAIRFLSFGFKYGVPVDADLVFDVRFLKNPYFEPELKSLPGTDPRVRAFVLAQPDTSEFIVRTQAWLDWVLPRYEREGKSYLTIAIGCTGGRHRSVVLVEAFADARKAHLAHRDVGRESEKRALAEAEGSTPSVHITRELALQMSPRPAPIAAIDTPPVPSAQRLRKHKPTPTST